MRGPPPHSRYSWSQIVLLTLGIVLAVLLAQLVSRNSAAARHEKLRKLAHELGLIFQEQPDNDLDDRYGNFGEMLRHGSGRRAVHTMHGEMGGYRLVAGDFESKSMERLGKSLQHISKTMSFLVVTLPKPRKLGLIIRCEGLLDDLGDALGFDDVDFKGNKQFSERFHVEGKDSHLITGELMEWLLQFPNIPRMEFEDGYLLMADHRDTWRVPEEFLTNIKIAQKAIDMLLIEAEKH